MIRKVLKKKNLHIAIRSDESWSRDSGLTYKFTLKGNLSPIGPKYSWMFVLVLEKKTLAFINLGFLSVRILARLP